MDGCINGCMYVILMDVCMYIHTYIHTYIHIKGININGCLSAEVSKLCDWA